MDKILLLGNSYSEDMEMYFPEICRDFGKEIEITSIGYASCTIDMHLQFLTNNEFLYHLSSYNFETRRWERKHEVSANDVIDSKEWNFIVIQQASYLAGSPETFANLDQLINLLKSHQSLSKTKILWHFTWPHPSISKYEIFENKYKKDPKNMYISIKENVQNSILSNKNISGVIPCGTAIMNILTCLPEDGVYRDVVHLSYHVGRYVAGLCFAKFMYGFDLTTVETEPFSIPLEHKELCIKAAIAAVNNPYQITKIEK